MTKEVLKLALEALEGLFVTHPHYTDEGGGAVAVWKLGGSYAARDAIEKIKSALAQPEQEPLDEERVNDLYHALAKSKRSKQFNSQNWFQAGFAISEAAYEIGETK